MSNIEGDDRIKQLLDGKASKDATEARFKALEDRTHEVESRQRATDKAEESPELALQKAYIDKLLDDESRD